MSCTLIIFQPGYIFKLLIPHSPTLPLSHSPLCYTTLLILLLHIHSTSTTVVENTTQHDLHNIVHYIIHINLVQLTKHSIRTVNSIYIPIQPNQISMSSTIGNIRSTVNEKAGELKGDLHEQSGKASGTVGMLIL